MAWSSRRAAFMTAFARAGLSLAFTGSTGAGSLIHARGPAHISTTGNGQSNFLLQYGCGGAASWFSGMRAKRSQPAGPDKSSAPPRFRRSWASFVGPRAAMKLLGRTPLRGAAHQGKRRDPGDRRYPGGLRTHQGSRWGTRPGSAHVCGKRKQILPVRHQHSWLELAAGWPAPARQCHDAHGVETTRPPCPRPIPA